VLFVFFVFLFFIVGVVGCVGERERLERLYIYLPCSDQTFFNVCPARIEYYNYDVIYLPFIPRWVRHSPGTIYGVLVNYNLILDAVVAGGLKSRKLVDLISLPPSLLSSINWTADFGVQ